MKYRKPPLSFEKQLHLLKERGLKISNDKHVLHVLEHINYYRLSGYFLPFQSKKDTFDDGTRLDDILYLYEFDGALRNLLAEGLARIEVSSKTQIAHYIALKYGAFGYIKDSNFDFKNHRYISVMRNGSEKSGIILLVPMRVLKSISFRNIILKRICLYG